MHGYREIKFYHSNARRKDLMQLYFIRHGQSINNALWGQTQDVKSFFVDPELTEVGKQQARYLADYLVSAPASPTKPAWDPQNNHGFGITHLYTSLMLRAVQTGLEIAPKIGVPLTAWIDLHERGGLVRDEDPDEEPVGYPGPNRQFFEAHYPQLKLPGELGDSGWWGRPWENAAQRRERALRVAEELVKRHAHREDRVLLISHGGFYNHLLAALFGFSDVLGWWFIMNNASISRIDFLPGEIQLVYHNRVTHLPADLIT
jgi:2,3-bisphosphoglycerate-dependent phosphoglycerate mutase